jgi:prepilin-type N-terminal cleavage/methylation domain-containing protein
MKRKRNRGVTLVEVMAALVIALVIAIGVMNYQYACAMHARKTDVRVTASRIGLFFLEDWAGVWGITDDSIYDPIERLGLDANPEYPHPSIPPANIVPDADLSGVPGLNQTFKSYGLFTNGTWFWIKLTYNEEGVSLRELGVDVAWSLDFGSATLDFDPQRLVHFSKYVMYAPPTPPG